MKKINIIILILFLTVIIAGKPGFVQDTVREIKTAAMEVELFRFHGNSYIGEIDISKIRGIKTDPDKLKDSHIYYLVGFDVDAIISFPDDRGRYKQKNYTIKKGLFERGNDFPLNDRRFMFLCMNKPGFLHLAPDQTTRYTVPLETVLKDETNISLQQKYYAGLLNEIRFERYNIFDDDELLYRFRVLENRAGVSGKISHDRKWRRSMSGSLLNMIELTSGSQAMEGSLQFSVMRDISSKDIEPKSVNVTTLLQPELKPHDFKKMLGGEKIKTTEIDRYAPYDSIYCRFDRIKYLFKCMDIAKLIQDEIPVFTKFIDWKDDNQSKLMTKLGLKMNPDLKKFYGLAIEEIAIAMADPYLIEGSDMAVIFHLNNKSLFTHRIKKYRKAFLNEISNAKEEKIIYNNTEITALTSADNRLSSYGFLDGDYAVIATSEWMAKKCADAKSGKARSAADNLDFQYLMKQHNGPGDAFVYIGDDFVSRAVSAPFKIGELRRVNCEANIKILKYAGRLYSLESGGREPNVKDLLDGGYISNIPVCPSDGSYDIVFGVPHCTKHGMPGHLCALSANTVTLATSDEAEKYNTFVANYHNYWRKYIDPVGIRLDFGDTISMRTIILPLIEHPDYRFIQDLFGGTPVSLESLNVGNSSVIFHAAVKLKAFDNYKSDLSHLSDQRLKAIVNEARDDFREKNPGFKGDPLVWIGNEADLFIIDDASLLRDTNDRMKSFGDMAFVNLIVLRIKVNDHKLARLVIPAVMKLLRVNLSVAEKKYGGELWKTHARRIAFNILLREDGLWITPFESHFEKMTQSTSFFANLARSESGKIISLKDATGIKDNRANFEIGVHPQNIKQLKKAVNMMTHTIYSDYCSRNIRRLNLLVKMHEPFTRFTGRPEDNSPLKFETGNPARCPAGGIYTRSDERYRCSFHSATEDLKAWNAAVEKYMNTETNLSAVLYKLKSIVVDLGFTKEGLETQIFIGDPLKQD